jgi:hypothetical protein
MKKLVIALATVVGVALALSLSSALADPGPCAKELANLQTDNGGSFNKVGECASYAAHGGVLYRPVVTITPSAVDANEPFTIRVEGFHPNTTVRVDFFFGLGLFFYDIPTDDAGIGTVTESLSNCGPIPIDWAVVAHDPQGIRAEAQLLFC